MHIRHESPSVSPFPGCLGLTARGLVHMSTTFCLHFSYEGVSSPMGVPGSSSSQDNRGALRKEGNESHPEEPQQSCGLVAVQHVANLNTRVLGMKGALTRAVLANIADYGEHQTFYKAEREQNTELLC